MHTVDVGREYEGEVCYRARYARQVSCRLDRLIPRWHCGTSSPPPPPLRTLLPSRRLKRIAPVQNHSLEYALNHLPPQHPPFPLLIWPLLLITPAQPPPLSIPFGPSLLRSIIYAPHCAPRALQPQKKMESPSDRTRTCNPSGRPMLWLLHNSDASKPFPPRWVLCHTTLQPPRTRRRSLRASRLSGYDMHVSLLCRAGTHGFRCRRGVEDRVCLSGRTGR